MLRVSLTRGGVGQVASSVGETAKLLGNLWRHLTEEERQVRPYYRVLYIPCTIYYGTKPRL